MEQPIWNFEEEPWGDELPDETSVNLRAYFDRMPDEKMRAYSPEWSDERILEWDGNFKSDGALMIACSERDVDIAEYRRVMELARQYRDRVRGLIVAERDHRIDV
jgi:hypothetical protein